MIRHLIVFNADAPENQVRAMAERAREVLGAIPGVTDVSFGIAVAATARYRYYLDVGFADASVIDSYREHPVHVRFAAEEFRPLAHDRITTDYTVV